MSTTMLRPVRALSALVALGALAATGILIPAQAQESRSRLRVESDDCRCVDKDGKEIENCSCFRSPDVSGILARVMPFGRARPRLGITISEVRSDRDASSGVRIDSVLDDGPADEAGLEKGDVITAVDGKSLLRPLGPDIERDLDLDGSVAVQRLMAILRDVEPGQEVRVEYLRDGETHSTTVTAEELDSWATTWVFPGWNRDPEEMREGMEDLRDRLRELRLEGHEPGVFEYRVGPEDAPHGRLEALRGPGAYFFGFGSAVAGVSLEKLNPRLGEYFGTEEGVLVTDVDADSTLGLEPGDVILEIGSRKATDPDGVRRILRSYGPDEAINFRIMRQKRAMSVQGTLGG